MKNVITIIFLIFLSSCINDKNKIEGIWLDADFTKPHTIEFTDSLWFDDLFAIDSIPYFMHGDTIFVIGRFDSCLYKVDFRIFGDTLWIQPDGEIQGTSEKYYRAISKHYFEDVKNHIGIDLNLPTGPSNLLDLFNGNSIYLPKHVANNDQHTIYLNNERVLLDSLLHEKLLNLKKQINFFSNSVFALYIDSEIEYGIVKLLIIELRKAGLYYVAYVSNPSRERYYQSRIGIKKRLPPIYENEEYYINPSIRKTVDSTKTPIPPKEYFEKPDYRKSNICKVEIVENQVFLNDSIFDLISFYEKLQKSNSLHAYIYVDDKSDYQTYFKFISQYDSLCQQYRNEKSIEIYQTEFDKLFDYEKIKNINRITRNGLIEESTKIRPTTANHIP